MRKISVILICLLFVSGVADAQYKINKKMYDHRTYSYQAGDPYSPYVAGLASFVVPGLGQMVSGEGRRGTAFMGGFAGSIIILASGVKYSQKFTESSPGNIGDYFLVVFLAGIGTVGIISIDIWSVVDAVHVSEVNNLAFRDKRNALLNIKVQPS